MQGLTYLYTRIHVHGRYVQCICTTATYVYVESDRKHYDNGWSFIDALSIQ